MANTAVLSVIGGLCLNSSEEALAMMYKAETIEATAPPGNSISILS